MINQTEPKYDDREVTLKSERIERVKLSELTPREREIFFAGVTDGANAAGKILLVLFGIFGLVVIAALYASKYFNQ